MRSYWLISDKLIITGMPKATSLEDIEALLPFREKSETTKDVS